MSETNPPPPPSSQSALIPDQDPPARRTALIVVIAVQLLLILLALMIVSVQVSKSPVNEMAHQQATVMFLTDEDLTLAEAKQLWEVMRSLWKDIDGSQVEHANLLDPEVPPEEVEAIQRYYHQPLHVSFNGREQSYSGYPVQSLEQAYWLMAPGLLTEVFDDGKPTALPRLPVGQGDFLSPAGLWDFLQTARVDGFLMLAEENRAVVTVRTEDLTLDIPLSYSEDLGWRVDRCPLLMAILQATATGKGLPE